MEYQDWRTSIEEPEQITNASMGSGGDVMGNRTIIDIAQNFCVILILVGLIVGIIYMIKDKKSKGKRIFIGIIIVVLSVLYRILSIIEFEMRFNMI